MATLFGQVTVRLPRFRCAACGGERDRHRLAIALPVDPGTGSASGASLRPHDLRPAADLLEQMFPMDAAKHPETLRRHTLKVGAALAESCRAHAGNGGGGDRRDLGLDLHPKL